MFVYNNGRFCHFNFSLFGYLGFRGTGSNGEFFKYMFCKNFLRRAESSLTTKHIFNLTYQARRLQVFFTIIFISRF